MHWLVMNQLQRHCWVPGGCQEVGGAPRLGPTLTLLTPPPTRYRQESGVQNEDFPCPPARNQQRYHRTLILTTFSHHVKIHWGSSYQKGQNIWGIDFCHSNGCAGMCLSRWHSQSSLLPSPSLEGPRLWNSLSLPSPVSPKENAARGKLEERRTMREKRRAKKEEGGFQTEYLHVEDKQGWGEGEEGTWGYLIQPRRKLRQQSTQFTDNNAEHRPQGSTSLQVFGVSEPFEQLLKAMDATHQKNVHLHLISSSPLMSSRTMFPQLAW